MFSDQFDIVYTSNHLGSLLQLPAIRPDQALFDLLGTSVALGPVGLTAIASQFDQITEGAVPCAFDVLSNHGTPRPIAVQFTRAGDHHWILSFEDLGARQAATDRVVSLALTDPLTGLGNRQRFRQSMVQALDTASDNDPIALLLIDLDRFKAVNDTLGPPGRRPAVAQGRRAATQRHPQERPGGPDRR